MNLDKIAIMLLLFAVFAHHHINYGIYFSLSNRFREITTIILLIIASISIAYLKWGEKYTRK